MSRPSSERIVADARSLAAKLEAEGRDFDAATIRRLCNSNHTLRSAASALHRDNVELRKGKA